LAGIVGVKQPQVSNWLSGKRIPNAENLIKLSNILELYPEELLEQLQSRREQA
jgi:transcriptional regulator with XRE-family HTH domain